MFGEDTHNTAQLEHVNVSTKSIYFAWFIFVTYFQGAENLQDSHADFKTI